MRADGPIVRGVRLKRGAFQRTSDAPGTVVSDDTMHARDVTIETLWRTACGQCELVLVGPLECRLRLWVKGALVE